MNQDQEYQATKIKPIVQLAMRLAIERPELVGASMETLWQLLGEKVPEVLDHKKCAGCGRSQKITVYEADLFDALLILAMARKVRENINSGMTFTDANKVHMPTLNIRSAVFKRQTKCDYLCFVKQQENWRGTGYWALTTWAWQALRGEPVPRAAKYWEGHLLDRSTETITLGQMFKAHTDLVQAAIAKRRAVKADRRAEFADYDPKQWTTFDAEFTKPGQQTLL